ncbi:MAG: serine hydrolase domain-containing protein [Emticicia sp.]|uniref:serine hydrolase domain-containing protein n=1 Tax=Emticicia sp. TaxID=1930953 RepID=UPI003BA6687C
MKKLIITAFVGLFLFTAKAQTQLTSSVSSKPLTVASSPESVGISSERLKRIDNVLNQLVEQNKLPGMVALFTKNGQIVYQKAFGYSDFQTKKPMKTDDIFRIASMTKAITSTAVMMLYEEGKFSLDDPISKFIPEFKNPRVMKSFRFADTTYTSEPAKSEITIRHLLTHTSGLGYGVIDGDESFKAMYKKAGIVDLFTTNPVKIGDNIKKLAKLPLHHNPGEKFTYSEGLDVLGYFIEIVSGKPFDEYLKQHLFEPLGMQDTYFYLPDSKKDRLVYIHKPDSAKTWVRYPVTFYDPNYPISGAKTFFSGGAGLSSTAKDYATFLQMLLNGGTMNGKRFLSRTTVDLLTATNQTGELYGSKGESFFSLGFSVISQIGQMKGNGSAGRFNWGGYFNTNYWADPKEKIIMVLMKQTQAAPDGGSEALFTRMIYQSIDD